MTRSGTAGSTEDGELAGVGYESGARVPFEHDSAAQEAHRGDAEQSIILLPYVEMPKSEAA